MKPLLAALIITFVVAGLGAAVFFTTREREVSGQVFVVRKDRESVRLSGMIIMAGKREEMEKQVDSLSAEQLAKEATARQRVGSALGAFEKASREFEEIKKSCDTKHLEMLKLDNEIGASAQRMRGATKTFIDQEVTKNRERQRRLQDGAFEERNMLIDKRRLETARDASQAELEEARKELNSLKAKASKVFFSPLATLHGQKEVISDADGRFHFKIPKNEQWMIVARAERMVFGKKERYFWAEPIGNRNEIVLSNINFRANDEETD